MFLILAAADSKTALRRELSSSAWTEPEELRPGLLHCGLSRDHATWPQLAFARQVVPEAWPVTAPSIRTWASVIADGIVGVLPDDQPWSLHVYPFEEVRTQTRIGARAWHTHTRRSDALRPNAAEQPSRDGLGSRCGFIRNATLELLGKRRRHLLRHLKSEPSAFAQSEALVQLVLTSPEAGFLSVLPAPVPFKQRHLISSFAGGSVSVTPDKQAPSRAYAKLLEAESRLGRRIKDGETCVDLGASPGGWTYVAMTRGASVTAVDRSELRDDLMAHRKVRFQRGDAFSFEPDTPVDWLLCDVIANAARSAQLIRLWLQRGWCKHFIVTLKVDESGSPEVLEPLKRELPLLAEDVWLLRLCANKKEVCVFGRQGALRAV